MNGIEKAVESQFAFALRNGGGKLSIGGKTIDALKVEPEQSSGELRRGRNRKVKTQRVGVLKTDYPSGPTALDRADFDGWPCVVSEDPVEDNPFTWSFTLRSP